MIYDVLDVPKEKRTFVSIPLGVFDILINTSMKMMQISDFFKLEGLKGKFEDAAEIARIVKYVCTYMCLCICMSLRMSVGVCMYKYIYIYI